jgi:quercetin dioxygenase-like cupin family protein
MLHTDMEGSSNMAKIQALHKDSLLEGASSPGITRHRAFEGEGLLILRSRAQPGAVSGWHNHGDYAVYGYIVTGTARFESGPGGKDAVVVGPGDFFAVPPHTVHREINPSPSEDLEVILFLRGTGPTVLNVEGPEPA